MKTEKKFIRIGNVCMDLDLVQSYFTYKDTAGRYIFIIYIKGQKDFYTFSDFNLEQGNYVVEKLDEIFNVEKIL